MKISLSVVILVILGIVAAAAAAMFTATLSAGRFGNVLNAEVADITVLTAANDVDMMTPIRMEDIVEKTVHPRNAPDNYFTDPSQIIGKRITIEMFEGQAFTRGLFPAEGSGAQLASHIPVGKRAVSIQISSYESLQGLRYPGAIVDVLASFRVTGNRSEGNAISTTLLQNIQVLAIANQTIGDNSVVDEEKANVKNRVSNQPSVTLLVTSKQAEALQLAMKFGQISLTLRNPSDEQAVDGDAPLLSEGVLAKLATLLGTTVTDEIYRPEEVAPVEPTGTVEEMPVKVQVPEKKKSVLRVNVYRATVLDTVILDQNQ